MNTSQSTSSTLISKAKGGDELAWGQLVEIYGPSIYLWARNRELQADDARDVMQEVFRNVVRSLNTFKKSSEHDSFRGWLYVITRNEVLQFIRREKQKFAAAGEAMTPIELLEAPISELGFSESIPAGDEHRIVRRALEVIRPEFAAKTWTAFWRMTIDGHSAADIANDLGMNDKAVRQAKYRVLLKLRAVLDDELDLDDSNEELPE